ncbi:hypothetical protein GCM10020000_49850 [Streptomyces olivoverticillatus]
MGAAGLVALTVPLVWPYYSFFSLLGADGLDDIHRPLYAHVVGRFCLVALGVVALGLRWRRDRRDPLALFFALGLAGYAIGGLSGHQAWGRVLPAVLLPAQIALAIETAEATAGRVRRALTTVTAAALLVGGRGRRPGCCRTSSGRTPSRPGCVRHPRSDCGRTSPGPPRRCPSGRR